MPFQKPTITIGVKVLSAVKLGLLLASFACYAVLVLAIWAHPQSGYDWVNSIMLAGRNWLSPYNYDQYMWHNPPWAAFLWWPLASLPPRLGVLANSFAAVMAVVAFVRWLGGSWTAVFAVLLSPPMYLLLYVSNIDWVMLLGLMIGGGWSVPILVLKPQVAGMAVLYFWQRENWRLAFWWPSALVGIISLLVWGFWPLQIQADPDVGLVNHAAIIFPWGVPLGLLALYLSLTRRSLKWSVTAGILLLPYWRATSLIALVALWFVKYPRWALVGVAAFWVLAALLLGVL